MSEFINIQNQEYNFLGAGSVIKGKIKLIGTSYITCSIEGEVEIEEKKELIIESEGEVIGKISCHNLEVHGHINGEIDSRGKVTIYPGAIVTGKVCSEQLIIYPGAVVNMTGKTEQTL